MSFIDTAITNARKGGAARPSGGGSVESQINAGPPLLGDTDDPYLFPYEVPEGTTVTNRSRMLGSLEASRTAPRYRASDLLKPLDWSPEKIADLQRALGRIGLYGKEKPRLGLWGKYDVAAFTELLQEANFSGRTWIEQIAEWRRRPPTDLLAKVNGDDKQRQTIRVTNPLDIQKGFKDTGLNTVGREVRATAADVAAYQEQERGAQRSYYSDMEANQGGTVTNEPSMGAFIENRIEQQNPEETIAYRMLGTTNMLMQELGLAG